MLVRFTKILVLTLTLILFRPAVANSSDMQFNMSISVMTGLVVNTTKNLVFPDGMITGATQLLTVAPADAGAAIFSAQGRKNKKVIASIISGTVLLSATGSSTTLTVDQFTITGPGNGKLDHSGLATFRVGARATITPTTEDGDYIGTNTFRLVYN